jgi:hypothetical protein
MPDIREFNLTRPALARNMSRLAYDRLLIGRSTHTGTRKRELGQLLDNDLDRLIENFPETGSNEDKQDYIHEKNMRENNPGVLSFVRDENGNIVGDKYVFVTNPGDGPLKIGVRVGSRKKKKKKKKKKTKKKPRKIKTKRKKKKSNKQL